MKTLIALNYDFVLTANLENEDETQPSDEDVHPNFVGVVVRVNVRMVPVGFEPTVLVGLLSHALV